VVSGDPFVNNPSVSGNIYFYAPVGEFSISALTPHDAGIQQISLIDAVGAQVGIIDLQRREETRKIDIAADVGDRSGPWHLTLAAMNVQFTLPTPYSIGQRRKKCYTTPLKSNV